MSASWYARKLAQTPAPRPSVPPVAPPALRPMTPAPMPAQKPEDRCPNCGSGNFLTKGTPRCFDCGYISGRDVSNSTSGMPAEGPVKAAHQVASGGYNPTEIIGRIS